MDGHRVGVCQEGAPRALRPSKQRSAGHEAVGRQHPHMCTCAGWSVATWKAGNHVAQLAWHVPTVPTLPGWPPPSTTSLNGACALHATHARILSGGHLWWDPLAAPGAMRLAPQLHWHSPAAARAPWHQPAPGRRCRSAGTAGRGRHQGCARPAPRHAAFRCHLRTRTVPLRCAADRDEASHTCMFTCACRALFTCHYAPTDCWPS